MVLLYPHTGAEGCVRHHVCPIALGADIEKRIKDRYEQEPRERKEMDKPIYFDAGGAVWLDMPYIFVRFKSYSVKYKLEQAPGLYAGVEARLKDPPRIYGGVECVSIYTENTVFVFPRKDAKVILRSLKKHALIGATEAEKRLLILKASSQHVHIPRPPAGES